ncbi:hypothetical protein HOB10_02965 [Candidatus Parcubacteria bacterium]|jgi:hypothetical protein|nr:hypothetical protein [Candidatus Parcubacteria bacterium]
MKWMMLFVFVIFLGLGLLLNGTFTPTEENPTDWSFSTIFRLALGGLGFCMLMSSLLLVMQRSISRCQYPSKILGIIAHGLGWPLAVCNIFVSFMLFLTPLVSPEFNSKLPIIALATFGLQILLMYRVWRCCLVTEGDVIRFKQQLYYGGEQFHLRPGGSYALRVITTPKIHLKDLEIICQEGKRLNLNGTIKLILNYGRQPRQVDSHALEKHYVDYIKQQIIAQAVGMSIFDILENKWSTETNEFLSVHFVWNGKSNLLARVA